MNKKILATFAVLMMLLITACAGSNSQAIRSGTARAVTATDELGEPDTRAASGAYTGASEYRVGAQDLLEISVFQVADLNRTVRVNSNGQISLPLVGSVQAGGKTVQELEAAIAGLLTESYLQNPQVTVFVKEYTSQRVTLEGAVKSPGVYSITGKTSLLQAIAMGGGLSDLANLQGVVVFRTVDGKKMAAVFDIRAIRAGNAADPQIYGDDIVVVDQSGAKTGLRRILETLPVFNLFGVY
ncbi:polysaccharide biosynthesis/export family protein [Arenimonas sp. MALMAid1274]|uniref:polysaccharide biosynthesis/export family protein n=1 Tax=Arenimonas sp. MALMAid1274 TaxID=3411630 RepID=UPI003BA24B0A